MSHLPPPSEYWSWDTVKRKCGCLETYYGCIMWWRDVTDCFRTHKGHDRNKEQEVYI